MICFLYFNILIHRSLLQINRGYENKTGTFLVSEMDNTFQSIMIRWFYHFTNNIETEAQEADSLAKLNFYLDEVDTASIVNSNLVEFTRTFVRQRFKPVLGLLCFRHYHDIYCGDVNENCFVESDNSSLKRDPMGPTANGKLFFSAHSITQHTKRRMRQLQVEAVKNFERRRTPKPSDTLIDKCTIKLSNSIVEDKRNQIVNQFEASFGKILLHSDLFIFVKYLTFMFE